MSYKTIAVHLDAGPRCATRVELAARLAIRHGSRLVGIAPTGLPDVIVAMNAAIPDAIECIALSAADLRANAETAAQAFEAACRRAGVASFGAEVVVDEAVDAVVRRGRCSDLIVVGQTDRGAPIDGVAFDFPQQVLLHAGPPVLVVPYTGTFASLGERVLVGWKDTREAARAVRDALPLLRDARLVSLVEVGPPKTDGERDGSLDAASAWLDSHSIPFDAHREIGLAEVAEQLLSRASDLDVDLIVCGGYGHSRLREWTLGGVTRHLLGHMTVPTLLSH
ncbi:MAG TPA: universal stress protein [Caldimonas sp.]|nr:universal stress protein [Caldimonas sp.]